MQIVQPNVLLKGFLLVFGLLALTACQTTEAEINVKDEKSSEAQSNSNKIEAPDFSNTAITHFHGYLNVLNKYPNHYNVFMYDLENGRTSWLGRKRHLGVEFAKKEGHKRCQNHPYSGNCKVVAVDGNIIWKDLNKDLKQTLMSPPKLKAPDQISEYSETNYKITSVQMAAYVSYLQMQKKYARALFFISEDGITSQQSLSITGDIKKETPKDLLQMGNVMCQIKSLGNKCYLFAMGNQPINNEAQLALQ